MRFVLVVTGPAYGTQQSSSAFLFSKALLNVGHQLISVFFYQEGVYNANQFTSPSSDECNLVKSWKSIKIQHNVKLNVCIASALRRGVINATESNRLEINGCNLEEGFSFTGLGSLTQAIISADRVIQF